MSGGAFRLEPDPPVRNALPRGVSGSAIFGGDSDEYRYELRRWWGDGPLAAFVGLNPSTAGGDEDDPTIRRCCGFARSWGCAGVIMVNAFAYRSTDPRVLKARPAPVGPRNDDYIRMAAQRAEIVVVCWGAPGGARGRRDQADPYGSVPVVEVLREWRLECLGKNRDGSPRHPLYLRADTPRELFLERRSPWRRSRRSS